MSEIDLEAALRAARERYAKASYQHHMAEAAHSLCGTPAADACTAMAKAAADAGSRLIALALVVGALGEHRITADHRPAERHGQLHGCSRCLELEAEAERIAREVLE